LPDIELQVADGLLAITSAPGGASVSINGRYRGTTPLEAKLAPGGTYEVSISKPGFSAVNRRVTMESRNSKSLRVELEARVGIVKVTVDPSDAELFVDGKSMGTVDRELTLPASPHRIEIRKSGYEPHVVEVTPKPGLPQELNIRLLTPEQSILAATPETIKTSQGLVMRLIKPGSFEFGAPRREQGRRPNETVSSVQLTRPFYMGLREITNTEYREFRPKHTSGAEKYRSLAGGDHPVVMLSWDDAAAFCNWLSDQESLPRAYAKADGKMTLAEPGNTGYRLPTEAEWTWVARYNAGGEKRKYPWGDSMPPVKGAGNYADLAARGILPNVLTDYDDGFPVTSPQGSFGPSPLGFVDLGGNAAEWVHDHYAVYSGQQANLVDPSGPVDGRYHVIRGSSWRHASISELRLSYRDFGDQGRLDVGFRIARFAEDGTE
jgi:formylglycine-generating enzyme required for sulfatase activity